MPTAKKVDKSRAKGTPTASKADGMPAFNDDDWKTVAALFTIGKMQPNNPEIPKKLGITKNAWHLRVFRLKNRLARVPLDIVDNAKDSNKDSNKEMDDDTEDNGSSK